MPNMYYNGNDSFTKGIIITINFHSLACYDLINHINIQSLLVNKDILSAVSKT